MMQWGNMLKVAFKGIHKNRMRSLLTALGIIIGVGAVIVMVAIGEGSQAHHARVLQRRPRWWTDGLSERPHRLVAHRNCQCKS